MGRDFRPLVIMQLGLIMVSSILLSLAVGLWLDSRFGTAPWGILLALLIGTSAGFLGVYRLISRVLAEIGRDNRD